MASWQTLRLIRVVVNQWTVKKKMSAVFIQRSQDSSLFRHISSLNKWRKQTHLWMGRLQSIRCRQALTT